LATELGAEPNTAGGEPLFGSARGLAESGGGPTVGRPAGQGVSVGGLAAVRALDEAAVRAVGDGVTAVRALDEAAVRAGGDGVTAVRALGDAAATPWPSWGIGEAGEVRTEDDGGTVARVRVGDNAAAWAGCGFGDAVEVRTEGAAAIARVRVGDDAAIALRCGAAPDGELEPGARTPLLSSRRGAMITLFRIAPTRHECDESFSDDLPPVYSCHCSLSSESESPGLQSSLCSAFMI